MEEENDKKINVVKNNLPIHLVIILIVLVAIGYLYSEYRNSEYEDYEYGNYEYYDDEYFVDESEYEDSEYYSDDYQYFDDENYNDEYNEIEYMSESEIKIAKTLFEGTYKKNLKIEGFTDGYNNYNYAVITNDNEVKIDSLIIYAIYFDENNTIVGIQNAYISEIYAKDKKMVSFGDKIKGTKRVEYFIEKNDYYKRLDKQDYETSRKLLTTKFEDVDGTIEIEVVNKSPENVSYISLLVSYYDENDTLIFAKNATIDSIKTNEKGFVDVNTPDYLKYTKCEVNIEYFNIENDM